jgi:uncharacterized protein (DUF2147 family)
MVPRVAFAASLPVVLLLATSAQADRPTSTPVGYWRATDYRTSKPCAIISIREVHGELRGRIEKIIDPPPGYENPICTKCSGNKRNKPVLGMEVIGGIKREGNGFSDGWALDPVDGNTYHLSLEVADGGKRLKVFGYVRVVFKIGRTEIWERISAGSVGLGASSAVH